MALFGRISLLCVVLSFDRISNASNIRISSDFAYQRLSVEVTDEVPRKSCQDTLNKLEVSNFVSQKVINSFQTLHNE